MSDTSATIQEPILPRVAGEFVPPQPSGRMNASGVFETMPTSLVLDRWTFEKYFNGTAAWVRMIERLAIVTIREPNGLHTVVKNRYGQSDAGLTDEQVHAMLGVYR